MYKQILILIICYILFNIKHINAAVVGCQTGTYCPYGVGMLNANLIGYYSFWANNRLLDGSGVSGSLVATGTPTYTTDCKWSNAQCSVITNGLYHTLPNINYATLSAANGWGICAWYMYDSFYVLFSDTFLYISGGTNCQISIKRISTSTSLYFTFTNNNIGFAASLTQTLGQNTWNHICITNKGRSWSIFENGFLTISTTTALADINAATIAMKTSNSNFAGKLDELRIYNTFLTSAAVMNIYSMRNIQCPVGTYQDQTDQTACKTCDSGTFQSTTGATACIQSIPIGSASTSTTLSSNNYLIAYWTFQPDNRLIDLTGITGNLVQTGYANYTTDCAWKNSECYLSTGSASNYIKLPTLVSANSVGTFANSPGYLSSVNGFSICTWFMRTANAYILDWRYDTGTSTVLKVYITGIYNVMVTDLRLSGVTMTITWVSTNGYNNWNHMCLTNKGKSWTNYYNGNWDSTLTHTTAINTVSFSQNFIGQTLNAASIYSISLDEFRYYNKELSLLEVQELYNYKLTACPAGTFQSQTNQNGCTPCAIGTYQPSTGQTACITCAAAISTGSVGCSNTCQLGPLPSSSYSSTPGTAMLTTDTNYISFNCPSGTYYSQVFNIQSLTASLDCSVSNWGVACAANRCCIWASSQYSVNWAISEAFDGILALGVSTNTLSTQNGVNQFIGIDFLTSQDISYVVIFDRSETSCSGQNYIQIYIGNTLYNGTTTSTTLGLFYPTTSQSNTLCYTGSSASQGYRLPLVAQCVGSGRYLYIVLAATNPLVASEIIVVSQPVCTNCSAGTYSINNSPNSICTNCPVGYYQTGIGMSYCNLCPTGTSQMKEGSSYCIGELTTGVYDQMGLNISNLIAHYTFQPVNPTRDSSGMTGDLSSVNTPVYVQDCQWIRAECRQFSPDNYYIIPSIDFGKMSIGTGWSMCFWFTCTGPQDSYLFTCRHFSGSNNNIQVYVVGSSTKALRVQIRNDVTVAGFTGTSNAIVYNQWYHVCITNTQQNWLVFLNSVLYSTFTLSTSIPNAQSFTHNMIGQNYGSYTEDTVKIDSVRIYNKVLNAAEVLQIYQYRMYSCPSGSYQPSSGKDACIPCPVNTFQNLTGQTACIACATYATYPGTAACQFPPATETCTKGAQPWLSTPTVNGTATLKTNTNIISFNCPAGTYYNGIYTIQSLTTSCTTSIDGVACSGSTCCIWASAVVSTGLPLWNAFNGLLYVTGWTDYTQTLNIANHFIGIDLGSPMNVVNVIIFEVTSSVCNRGNTMSIYIGNTLYSDQITPISSGTAYPIATQTNTLCYTGSTVEMGYRTPLIARCQLIGRYIYIVQTIALQLVMKEIIITGEQVCTLCSPGTYSTYVEPNTKCTACPIGTYQSQTGMSYCTSCPAGSYQDQTGWSTCQSCPFGLYQPDTGATTCILAPLTARYSVSSSSIVQCPIGSYQDEPAADTCKPCGLGTYQNLVGQTSCIFCNGIYNSYYGSITCPQTTDTEQCRIGLQPNTFLTTTPGAAMLTTGANYIAFNCPSGMYSTTVSTLTSLTVGCTSSYYTGTYTGSVACSTTCCMWMSSQWNGSTTTPLAFDGILNYANSWNIASTQGLVMNEYFGIDLGVSKYVDSILLFDVIGLATECSRQDGIQIYIGNTLYTPSGSKIANSTGYSYPVSTSLNTLCYTVDASTQGYRQPLSATCQMSGRYVYIVSTNTNKILELNEIVVLGQPACTLCPAGTYSVNTIPNTECSLCPGGTYSTGSGMTSKSACTICPLGTYSTGMGSTASSVCTTCS